MQDLHKKIDAFYESKINELKIFLTEKYELQEISLPDPLLKIAIRRRTLTNHYFWKIKLHGKKCYPLLIAVPYIFPDSIPMFFLDLEMHPELRIRPHIEHDGYICVRDKELTTLNEQKSKEAINLFLNEIVENIESRYSDDDYLAEFNAYWMNLVDKSNFCQFLSNFSPSDNPQDLKLYRLETAVFGSKYLISKPGNYLINWLNKSITIVEDESKKIPYIPTKQFSPYDFYRPIDLINIVQDNAKKTLKEYILGQQGNLMLGGFFHNNEYVIFGWNQSTLGKIKGFRKGKAPLGTMLANIKNHIFPQSLTRLDLDYLFKRPNYKKIEKKVLIVGVGSIGSLVAMNLAKSGVVNITLVDNDKLQAENSPRHLCGFSYAKDLKNKAEAVSEHITNHLPYINCEYIDDDILSAIKNEKINLLDFDLIISATGSFSTERRLNHIIKNNKLNIPLIALWTEPLGIAGHMLYIHPFSKGCYLCAFKDGSYKWLTSENPKRFFSKFFGCQSMFSQYSHLDISMFIDLASKKIVKYLNLPPPESHRMCLIGDVEMFKNMGGKLDSRLKLSEAYSIIEKQLEKSTDCEECNE